MDLCFMQLLCPLPVVDTPTSCPLGTSPPVEVMLQVGFVRPHLQGLGGVVEAICVYVSLLCNKTVVSNK